VSIKYITIDNVSDLKIILDSPISISCDIVQQEEETLINMWALSIDPEATKAILIKDLTDFVSSLFKARTQQVEQLDVSCPVVFYMWFDEMAAQLRFNIISDFGKALPFTCELEFVNSPQAILEEFLASHLHAGISWNEFEELGQELDDEDEKPFILKVFVERLILQQVQDERTGN
jgi:hypothetical protein